MSDAFSDPTRLDPETLAAFMEGRLSEDERRRVLAELAESEADLEVLADAAIVAAAFDDEDDGSGNAAGESPGPTLVPDSTSSEDSSEWAPIPSRAGVRWKLWLPLAAAVAGVALIPSLLDRTQATGLGQYRLDLVALGPVAAPSALPVPAGGDAVRSGSASSDLVDALSPTARSFRRGAAFARLTVLAPDARAGSPEAVALEGLLRSTAGGAARPVLDAWLGDPSDGDPAWRAAAGALQEVEGVAPAFRMGLLVEGLSLSASMEAGDAAARAEWAEALEADFAALPSAARSALEADYARLQDALDGDASPEPADLRNAIQAFAAPASNLGGPADAGE
jgi:hypothetical protein